MKRPIIFLTAGLLFGQIVGYAAAHSKGEAAWFNIFELIAPIQSGGSEAIGRA